jgi:N-acetyl-anhydromuramyl-L-alanine amidase AmpD
MANSRAIDVAAYLAVQDCRKYKIPITVIAPPYAAARAGITDHAYVTKVLKDGTHSDVGPNFPWDHFTQRVAFWVNPTPAVAPPKPPVKTYPRDFTDRELLEDLWKRVYKLGK